VHSRDCLAYTGFHNESIKHLVDWEFILRIANKYKLVYIPEVLVDYYLDYCGNSITRKEDGVSACRHIKEANRVYSGRVKIIHDAITYTWKNIPDEKRHNWVQAKNEKLNTSSFTAWGYPFMLQVEPTNISNLSCPLCPTGRADLNRPPRHLKLEEFKGLIDDMERYLLFLVLWDRWEPLMNPELPAMVRYAAERDIKAVTGTNGHFFKHEDYMAELLKSGLSTLIVAIDSVSADNYEVYRQQGDLAQVVTGIEKLMELKKKVKSNTLINLRMVVMKQNEHEVDKTRHYARAIGADCFTVKTLNPSCGSTARDSELVPENPKYRRFTYKKDTLERISVDQVCMRVWTMSNIFSNGDVVPCCYDYRGDLKVGNVFERSFTEIWNSQAYRELRKRIFTQKNSIPICRECYTNFQNSEYGMFAEFTRFKSRPEENFLDKYRTWFYSPQVRAVIKRILRKH
jgi:radical SAM protein with 4Fe4S-binding SPASM domain